MSNKNDGKFRKKVPFAAVSLIALQDDNLSLKAKGLYGLIQSYITIPKFTLYKSKLIEGSTDGLRAFNSAWDELKEHGYLKQYRIREEKGWRYEYDLLDEPDLDTPATINVGLNGEIIEKPIKEHKSSESTKDETKNTNTHSDKPKTSHNNHPTSNNNSNHHINNNKNNSEENNEKQMLSERSFYRELILENIDYEWLSQEYNLEHKELNELVELMVDTVCTKKKVLRIAGDDLPAEAVKSRFLKLDSEHIIYVLTSLKKNTTRIRNIKQYLLTTLYNSSFTIENYYLSQVNHDLYGQD